MSNDKELTQEEINLLKEMVQQEKNYRWLRSTIRSIASWLAIVMSAIALAWEHIVGWWNGS